jgi:hypothetical protein
MVKDMKKEGVLVRCEDMVAIWQLGAWCRFQTWRMMSTSTWYRMLKKVEIRSRQESQGWRNWCCPYSALIPE